MRIRVKKLHPNATLPAYQTDGAAGMDLVACEQAIVPPRDRLTVDTGVALELPPGFCAQVLPRSGLARKRGLVAAVGLVDPDYRGAIGVTLVNLTDDYAVVKRGERIANLLVVPFARVELEDVGDGELSETARGERGWGSTGV